MNRISHQEPAELLSALADGECCAEDVGFLLQAWTQQADLSARYQRLCVTRAALRGIEFAQSVDLCPGVLAAIAPRRRSLATLGWRARRRVLRPAVGLALAASLGALLTFSAIRVGGVTAGFGGAIPQLAHPAAAGAAGQVASNEAPVGARVIPAAARTPADGSSVAASPALVAVSANAGTDAGAAPVTEVSWSDLRPQTARQLDNYLIEHIGYRGMNGMGGTLGYARVAAHEVQVQPVVAGSH